MTENMNDTKPRLKKSFWYVGGCLFPLAWVQGCALAMLFRYNYLMNHPLLYIPTYSVSLTLYMGVLRAVRTPDVKGWRIVVCHVIAVVLFLVALVVFYVV